MIGVDRFGNPVSLRPQGNTTAAPALTNPNQNITVR
jgi:hypothetical protein